MKKSLLFVIIIIFIILFPMFVYGAISASERASLIALYNSTNGDNWGNNNGWKTPPLHSDGFAMPGTENSWEGINTDGTNHVTRIYLYNNNLNGTLPQEFWDLTYLEYIQINHNTNLTGTLPAKIEDLTRLWKLNLYGNKLSGTIPASIINLSNLTYLNMGDNQFTGPVPANLDRLPKLEHLSLHVNQLSGVIPPEIGNITTLEYLDLCFNDLTGTIPPELGKLSNLVYLRLSENQLTGTIPKEFGGLLSLEGFHISFTPLTGPIPDEMKNCKKMKTIRLDDNQFTGGLPVWISQFKDLEYLCVSGNQFSGPLPPEYGALTKLWALYISNNQFDGSIPAEYGNMASLEHCNLSYNKLSGTIPNTLGQLRKLDTLNLDSNFLSGSLPSSLGNCPALANFSAKFNRLSGTIPSQYANISTLVSLGLNSNDLEGNLPEWLGSLPNIEYLDFGCNHFTGPIPQSIGNLKKLISFQISSNKITGKIPDNFSNLTNLSTQCNWTGIYYNGLYTDNSSVKNFLDNLLPGWEDTQSIAPSNIAVSALSSSSVRVSWNTIPYSSGTGGYQVYYSFNPDGPWTYAGVTTDKTATSLDIIGLYAGTTYYFSVRTHSGNLSCNPDGVTSDYSTPVSVVTPPMAGTHALTVQSSPANANGVTITVSPVDYYGNGSGSTSFARLYNEGTTVTLTAPSSFNNSKFLHWDIDGVIDTNSSVQVTMNANHAATAVYEQITTYSLSVQSTPETGVNITVSPNDTNGNNSGITNFSRTYNENTLVTLSAPTTFNGNSFLMWVLDGTENSSAPVQVLMNANHTAVAIYESDNSTPATLKIECTHGSGTPIGVSPVDLNGDSDGTTKFERSYSIGTSVTLTAPQEHNGQKFDHWSIDGTKLSNSVTVQFTITGDHKAKAYYVTPSNPGLVVRPVKMNFGYVIGDTAPSQIMRVTINGSPVTWTAEANVSWLNLSHTSGYGSTEVTVTVNPDGMPEGKTSGIITVTAPDAEHSPQTIDVNLKIYRANGTEEPLGEFSTPQDNSNVSSSIPVTGWVVDDIGIESVKIYREGKNANDLIYIGDAVFVEGARPDVEEAFPEFPKNYEAGWGYMLLTNFLPNEGNGVFRLHAIATDVEGHEVSLGVKTITCDNANAVKPFGAIDTPTQGGKISGSSFINWGWVLTPQPNMIPTDGSTIFVWIDGVKVGSPVYNIYRQDIATFFPDYANCSGAIGYFYIDTTAYENGIHSIQWQAIDSAGNKDGIGSRYFTIYNTAESRLTQSQSLGFTSHQRLTNIGNWTYSTLMSLPQQIEEQVIQIHEDNLLEFPLSSGNSRVQAGFMIVGDELRPLPIGSTVLKLDSQDSLDLREIGKTVSSVSSVSSVVQNNKGTGQLNWQIGPGFLGNYRLVFVIMNADGQLVRRMVTVKVIPGIL